MRHLTILMASAVLIASTILPPSTFVLASAALLSSPACCLQLLSWLLYTVCRARICKPFKEPRNRFPAWRVGTTTLFDVPARQATKAGAIDSLESILGLLKHLHIRAMIASTIPPPSKIVLDSSILQASNSLLLNSLTLIYKR